MALPCQRHNLAFVLLFGTIEPMVGDNRLTTPTGGEPWQVHLARLGVGIVAGAVVALVKYAGSDTEVAARIAEGNFGALLLRMFGFSILPIILGAVGGWISDERKVHKIFWIAITAPVVIAAAAGAHGGKSTAPPADDPGKAGWNFEQLLPISPAYGNEALAAELAGCTPTSTYQNPFVEGLQIFLGAHNQTRYRVVVHSVLDDKEKAEGVAKRLNRDFPLPAPACVADRKPGNRYWPVVINGWTTYAEAKKLKEIVQDMNFGLDDKPYISIENR